MQRWTMVRDSQGYVQLMVKDLVQGTFRCHGHGQETDSTVKDLLGYIWTCNDLLPGDLVVLPSGAVLQFALKQGLA